MTKQIEAINGLLKELKEIKPGERTSDLEAACGGLRMAAERLATHLPALAKLKEAATAEAAALEKRAKELRDGATAPLATAPAPAAVK